MRPRIKNTRITILTISWIQIIGGIYGIGLIMWLLMQTEAINGPVLLILLIGISLSIFSIISGRYLNSNRTLKLGLILSLINFGLQIVSFKSSGYGFEFSSGIKSFVGFDSGIKFDFGIVTTNFDMSINTNNPDFALKINIIAILVLWILADIYDELFKKVSTNIETESIN